MEPDVMTGRSDPLVDVDADLVEYVVVGVPDTGSLELIARALTDLVDVSAIRILDVVVLAKAADGTVDVLEVGDVDSLTALGQTEGWYGGLLSSHDVALVATTLAPDSAAVVLLAEDRWAEPLAQAARTAGGRLLGGERIPRNRVQAGLAGAVADLVAHHPSDHVGEEAEGATHRTVP
jgi:hypothetical protein